MRFSHSRRIPSVDLREVGRSRPAARKGVFSYVLFLAILAIPASAQSSRETVEGVVSSPVGVVVAATVHVTRGPDRLTIQTATDSLGHFATVFAPGTGDYLVHVAALGFQPLRVRVVRANRTERMVDTTWRLQLQLVQMISVLPTVVVREKAERPARWVDTDGAVGSADRVSEGVVGALSPDQEGNIAAILANVPGMATTPSGVSVLGLSPSQNAVSLNGLAFSAGSLPRGARTRVTTSSSPYDPSRGGFSGAHSAIELSIGPSFFFARSAIAVDAPGLAFGGSPDAGRDRNAAATVLSVGAEGPVGESRWVFNAGADVARKERSTESLRRPFVAHIAADTLDAIDRILAAQGLVSAVIQGPRTVSQLASGIIRLDHAPYDRETGEASPRTWGLTAYAAYEGNDGLGGGPTVASSRSGSQRKYAGMLSAVRSTYVGSVLSETRSALSGTRVTGTPYSVMPGAHVIVSALPSNLLPSSDAVLVDFGGDASFRRTESRLSWEVLNETQWIRARHRLKATLGARTDAYASEGAVGALGDFSYASLGDLALNRPASFVRTLNTPGERGAAWGVAASIRDLWRPTPRFQLLFGGRIESEGVFTRLTIDPAVAAAVPVRANTGPGEIFFSPRAGFNWVYGSIRNGAASSSVGVLGGFTNPPRGVLRGGIGVFRNRLAPDVLRSVSRYDANAQGESRLMCVGSAVPPPDWSSYNDDERQVPRTCLTTAGGISNFADNRQRVELIDAEFRTPRSLRASLGWSSGIGPLSIAVDGVYSRNDRQPSVLDLNFVDKITSYLPNEGGRPLYVSDQDVDPRTGTVSSVGSRMSPLFGSILSHRSDLASDSRQLTFAVAPVASFQARTVLVTSYTISQVTGESRGFNGTTFSSPATIERAHAPFAVTHQFLVQAGVVLPRKVSVTTAWRLTSGLRFTPLVNADINGDGLRNDRAFVFGPSSASPDAAALTARLGTLLLSPEGHCLRSQMGSPVSENSCEGPWTLSSNVRIAYAGVARILGRRVFSTLNIANPVAAADLLLHGQGDRRGWGVPVVPDPVLYYVRGFNPSERRFVYALNDRFGRAPANQSSASSGARLTIDVSIVLGSPIEEQVISRVLNVGRRGRPGTKLDIRGIKSRYARTVPNVFSYVLTESDSLMLVPEQVVAVRAAQLQFRQRVDTVWTELATYLDGLPDQYDASLARRRSDEATSRAWRLVNDQVIVLQRILSALQMSMLPDIVKEIINTRDRR